MKVKVSVSPVSGKPQSKEVDVPDNSTVEDALKAAGYGTKGFNFTVNGEPASAGTKLDPTVLITAAEVQISATEKVAGS